MHAAEIFAPINRLFPVFFPVIGWREVRLRLHPPPRSRSLTEISRLLAKSPELAGLRAGAWSLRAAESDSKGHFGTFVSGLKIPFPGNRDRAKQRLVRMRRYSLGKAENLVLLATIRRASRRGE